MRALFMFYMYMCWVNLKLGASFATNEEVHSLHFSKKSYCELHTCPYLQAQTELWVLYWGRAPSPRPTSRQYRPVPTRDMQLRHVKKRLIMRS